MTKKVFAVLNAALLCALLIGMATYMRRGTLLIKGSTSACFALLGVINLVYAIKEKAKDLRYPAAMCAGLISAMLGDILLGPNFVMGVALFALGHVLYVVSFVCLLRFEKRDLPPCVVIGIAAAGVVLLWPTMDFGGALLQGVCLIYALIISCMVGKAVSNYRREKSLLHGVIALGSVLFFISDLMLVLYMFGDAPRIADRICLLTYFPAQGLLAGAVYLYVAKKSTPSN